MYPFQRTLHALAATLICLPAIAKPIDPGQIPLLIPQQGGGLVYSEVDPAGQPSVDLAWFNVLTTGLDAYALLIDWRELVHQNGLPNTAPWLGAIEDLHSAGLQTYLGIAVIDTNNLQIPETYLHPKIERELGKGISFDSPEMIAHFGQLLDALVPELVSRGVFFVSIGNEVDIWLEDHPDQIQPYADFVEAARQRIHSIEPAMSVGSCLTSGVVDFPEISAPILNASDAAVFTYYQVGPDGFDVREPVLIEPEIDMLLDVAGDMQVIFQEIGYPSGWSTKTTIDSSVEKQREFVERMFPAMASRPQIRYWSFLHLGDWGDEMLELFSDYYGIDSPGLDEFLGTLGLYWNDGTPKPAYQEFLRGLNGCPTDLNGDGQINSKDLTIQMQSPQDINGDGLINAMDIRCLRRYINSRMKKADRIPLP